MEQVALETLIALTQGKDQNVFPKVINKKGKSPEGTSNELLSSSANLSCMPSTSADTPENTRVKVKHPRARKKIKQTAKENSTEAKQSSSRERDAKIYSLETNKNEDIQMKKLRRKKRSKNIEPDNGIKTMTQEKSIQEILDEQQNVGSACSTLVLNELLPGLVELSLNESSKVVSSNHSLKTRNSNQVLKTKKKIKTNKNHSVEITKNPEHIRNNALRNHSDVSIAHSSSSKHSINKEEETPKNSVKKYSKGKQLQRNKSEQGSAERKPRSSNNASQQYNKENATKKPKGQRSTRANKDIMFEDYLSLEEVTKGIDNGDLFVGSIRVNPKNANESYVGQKDRNQQDFVITTFLERNRAFDGDIVVLKVKPKAEWRDNQKSASVVFIKKMLHPRTAVGHLKMHMKNTKFAIFTPRDHRVPRMKIPIAECPKDFLKEAELYEEHLFLAKIKVWSNVKYAMGTLLKSIGVSGDIAVETLAILAENCLNVTPFGAEINQFLPQTNTISSEEIAKREDLRKECIFTIDPATARDLDDAVSCKELENGNFEIGVHISDVTYYLQEGTALDEIVCDKATTIYLVDSVYHMLPVELCLHCSLLPGQDKLSFSVFWEMTPEGDVISHRFSKSILNSCAQLSYEHAEEMVQNPDRSFEGSELPVIHNGFTSADLSKTVNHLQRIAVRLRKNRYDNGALQINQPKVTFHLNKETGLPVSMSVYENKHSHRLIEEFMLLANITVAKRINEDFPDLAFLRCHFPPAGHMMTELQTMMEELGIHLDISSSGNLHKSLCKYMSDDPFGKARTAVLNHLCAKPMTRASYYCASDAVEPEDYLHYALSVDIYTHFTSPIRRYADVMVHRLLNASLEYSEKPNWNPDVVAQIAANCNKQKYNAKKAGEQSSDLFLCHYIDRNQPFYEEAVVVDVKDHSLDVIVIKTGNVVRIYMNNLEELLKIQWKVEKSGSTNKKVWQMHICFPAIDEIPVFNCSLQIFSKLTVALKRKENTHKLEAHPIHPMKW